MSKQSIELKGVRVHNLKNIDLNIRLNQFVVITGVSGSGKSSLAFDTLYAEGQRRYVESLSSYARQFLGRLNKPECDYIKGIPPAVAIEQKVNTSNPRSTVGRSKCWVVKGDPSVTEVCKRLFPGSAGSRRVALIFLCHEQT